MSHFASNLASLARSKLHSTLSSGSRDNLSLHRWVLLKNSIIRDDTPLHIPTEEPDVGAPALVADVEEDDEDELLNLIDGDLFDFQFPDPGHRAQAPQDAAAIATEAQWFDSLLETLGDDEDDDQPSHHLSTAVKLAASPPESDDLFLHSGARSPPHSDPVSPVSSCSDDDDYSLASPPQPQSIAVPYPVPYPPLVKPYDAAAEHDDADDDESCYYAPRARSATAAPYFLPYNDLEDSYLSMPDVVEDTASDDDSEMLPSTPFSRSRSSFSLSSSDIDPASVPLPREQRARGHHSMDAEPHIYTSADDDFPFDPNPDMPSDSPVYRPFFYQNC